MRKAFNTLGLLLMLWGGTAVGASPAVPVGKSAGGENESQLVIELKTETLQLKEQNKLLREYQGSMLSTVYWSLGVIATIVALLMGYSIFTNFKFYDQDKQRLKTEIQSFIDKSQAELITRVQQERLESERVVELKNENTLSTFLSQNSELQARLDTARTELSNEIKSLTNQVIKLPVELENIKNYALRSEVEIRTIEGMVWELRGVHSNTLLAQIEGIKAACASSSSVKLKYALERMSDTLDTHFITPGKTLTENVFTWGTEALDMATVFYPSEVTEVRNKLNRVKPTTENIA
ncbi:hypothetical protein ACXX9E_09125 [Pseudomonas sp. GNP014]